MRVTLTTTREFEYDEQKVFASAERWGVRPEYAANRPDYLHESFFELLDGDSDHLHEGIIRLVSHDEEVDADWAKASRVEGEQP